MGRLLHDQNLRQRLVEAGAVRLAAMRATDATEQILASLERLTAPSA